MKQKNCGDTPSARPTLKKNSQTLFFKPQPAWATLSCHKIFKNKPLKISNRGGASPVHQRWIRLC